MPVSQSVSFIYGTQTASFSLERENLGGPLIIREIVTWILRDKLNQLNEIELVIKKDTLDMRHVYLERDVYVPGFDFEGIITGIEDNDHESVTVIIKEPAWHFTRRIYKIGDNLKEYNISLTSPASLPDFIDAIITSANSDMPFTWVQGEDTPATSDFDFDVKWKNYYQVLKLVAINSLNDLWFEKKIVRLGKKGKDIVLDTDENLYEQLKTRIDLDTYGNIVHVVGAEVGGTNVHANAVNNITDLQYNYERVVSNNNLKDQNAVDSVVDRILTEFDSIHPDLNIIINQSVIHKYNMKSGDVIKIHGDSPNHPAKGFFRIIELTVSNVANTVKLQFSKDGKFIPRLSDSLDILQAALIKIHDLELNS